MQEAAGAIGFVTTTAAMVVGDAGAEVVGAADAGGGGEEAGEGEGGMGAGAVAEEVDGVEESFPRVLDSKEEAVAAIAAAAVALDIHGRVFCWMLMPVFSTLATARRSNGK